MSTVEDQAMRFRELLRHRQQADPTDVRYRIGGFDHGNRDWAPVSVYFTVGGVRMATRFTITREALRMTYRETTQAMAEEAARAKIIEMGGDTMSPARPPHVQLAIDTPGLTAAEARVLAEGRTGEDDKNNLTGCLRLHRAAEYARYTKTPVK